MSRWKNLIVCLCAAALLVGLLLPAAADEVTVYQTAVNDNLQELSADTMPAWVGGTLYVPYTVFDRSVTEVDLGVSYGQKKGDGVHTLTLYSDGAYLVFDVLNGTCTDNLSQGKDMKAMLRGGRVFVPLGGVCSFFGLKSSYTPTSYGTLVRITNSQARLSTKDFVEAAASSMRTQYNKFVDSQTPQQPGESPSPSPGVTSQPGADDDPDTQDKHDVRVYLAFRCEDGAGLGTILDALDRSGVKALFLFRVEDLAPNDAWIRRIVGTGHTVGFIAQGDTADEIEHSMQEGNALLERIAHLHAHIAAGDGISAAVADELALRGFIVWNGNVDGLPGTRSQTGLSRAVLDAVDAKKSVARITMDDSILSAGAFNRILNQLRGEQYSIRLPVETELG